MRKTKNWEYSPAPESTDHIKLKKQYKKVSYFKPRSSRNESSEIFIVAENFIV